MQWGIISFHLMGSCCVWMVHYREQPKQTVFKWLPLGSDILRSRLEIVSKWGFLLLRCNVVLPKPTWVTMSPYSLCAGSGNCHHLGSLKILWDPRWWHLGEQVGWVTGAMSVLWCPKAVFPKLWTVAPWRTVKNNQGNCKKPTALYNVWDCISNGELPSVVQ